MKGKTIFVDIKIQCVFGNYKHIYV